MLVKIKVVAQNPADGDLTKQQDFLDMARLALDAVVEIKRTTPDVRIIELTTTSKKLRNALLKKTEQRNLKLMYEKQKRDYDDLVAIIEAEE